MSLLDIENDIEYDIKLINRIYQLWLGDSGAYRACGFYKGIYANEITTLPENWMDWVLHYCTQLSNYGDYCCVIAPLNFDPEFNVYEPFKTPGDQYEVFSGYGWSYTKPYTVRDLLTWYETNNEL